VAVTHAEDFNRTAKLLVDRDGRTIEQANEDLASRVLQLDVGGGWQSLLGIQAAVLTAVNTGSRAFLGGVHVRLGEDGKIPYGWARGMLMSQAITLFGGSLRQNLSSEHSTVVFGSVSDPVGKVVVHCTWSGWSGGVVDEAGKRFDERRGNALSAALAGAVAVSECFQNAFHSPAAGRRDAGLSLWRPDANWREENTLGPPLRYLPDALWLAGLGHLGQAYAWVLGLLDYPEDERARVLLQDVDTVSEANCSTSLMAQRSDAGTLKTRLVAEKLETQGFGTSIVERLFDSNTKRQPGEPALVLSGFDNHRARRALASAEFELIVDAGLGSAYDRYLNILVHSFLRGFDGQDIYPDLEEVVVGPMAPAYEAEIARQVEAGASEAEARCGAIELAGKAVGASFVGAVTATLVLAEAIRPLHGGYAYDVLGTDLGYLDGTAARQAIGRDFPRLGYVPIRG
jgi:hypothetical protein